MRSGEPVAGAGVLIHNAVICTKHYETLIFSVRQKAVFHSVKKTELTALKCWNHTGHTPGQIIILSHFHIQNI